MKKVLSLVLSLAMVLGSFSMVSAAPMSDVTDPVLKKAVDRLVLLDVLTGYPDGSFKPEQTITRAEFAAVAVRAKGLEDAANAAKGLATGFTDVAAGNWEAGYVGTAGKLGIVNGVGNGLFAPNAPVKYEEAVTMIVRALGYEPAAQTKGGYPYGHLIVANEIGLLDDVKGTQGMPASRGIVAQITDNALEIPKMIQVGFGSETKWVESGSKEHGTDAEKQLLLHDLGVDEIKGIVTNNLRTKSTVKADEVEIYNITEEKTLKYEIAEGVDTDAVLFTGVTAWAKDDVIFSMSIGYNFRYDGDKYVFDEDQVLYDAIVVEDTTGTEAYLYVQDDEYDWLEDDFDDAVVYINNERADSLADLEDMAYGRFVLNDDDEIAFAYLFAIENANTGLVTAVDADDMEYVNLNADDDVLALDDAEKIYVFNKNLAQASLEDIKEDSAVFYWIDEDDNYFIIVSDQTIEGNLDAVRVRDNRLTVAGTNVTVVNALFSTDDGENYDTLTKASADFEEIEDYVDENVVLYYNLVGNALAVVTDTDATSSKVYGLATWITGARNPELSVYTVEGKEVDYTFEDSDEADDLRGINFDTTPTGVYFKINKDGEIKEDTIIISQEVKNFNKAEDKHKYGTWGTDRLYLTEDTVIIEAYDDKANDLDPSVIKYENIINKVVDTNNSAIVIREKRGTNAGDDDLGLLIFTNVDFTSSDDSEYGIVTSDPTRRGTDYKLDIDVYGKGKETYTLAKLSDAHLRTGDIIEFEFDSKGEVVVIDHVDFRDDRADDAVYEVVESKSTNFITTNRGSYRNTKDTVYYSSDRDGNFRSTSSSFSRIDVNSVILLIEDDNELMAVMDITAYVDLSDNALLASAVKAAEKAQADYKLAGGLETDAVYTSLGTALAATPQVTATIKTRTAALVAAKEALVNADAEAAAVEAVVEAVYDYDVDALAVALNNELFEGEVAGNMQAYLDSAEFGALVVTSTADDVNDAIADVNAAEESDAVEQAKIDAAEAVKTAATGSKNAFLAALRNELFEASYDSDNADVYWAEKAEFAAIAAAGADGDVDVAEVIDLLDAINDAVALLETELAKVIDKELPALSTIDAATLEAEYGIDADITLTVVQVGTTDEWTVTLEHDSFASITDSKVVTITVA